MAEPRGYVPSPVRHQRLGGIKAVADFVPAERMFAQQGIDWTSEPCTFPEDAPGLCWGVDVVGTKDTDEPVEYGTTQVFALYAGDECFMGSDLDHEGRARRVLEAGEDRELEEKLVALLALEDATATDFPTFLDGIAAAESAADNAYIGRPTIVMNRGDAIKAVAADVLHYGPDGAIMTANGTPVLASGKVPAGDFYVTGSITVYHSDFVVTRTEHWQVNRELALAERAYAFGIDCDYVVAYSVTEVP